jgi:hypothetical protein
MSPSTWPCGVAESVGTATTIGYAEAVAEGTSSIAGLDSAILRSARRPRDAKTAGADHHPGRFDSWVQPVAEKVGVTNQCRPTTFPGCS